jgi:hypothetical protein
MERKVINLEIYEDLEDFGVDAIALVDEPAIEKNWLYFKAVEESPFDVNKLLKLASEYGVSQEDLDEHKIELSKIDEDKQVELASVGVVYKYDGEIGSDSRRFCKEMKSLNRYYSFNEIIEMSNLSVNPGFGLNGADTYNIWLYKGGPNCKHKWQQFYITNSGKEYDLKPAQGNAGIKPEDMPHSGYAFNGKFDLSKLPPYTQQSKMLFADESKRELVGPVAIPDLEIPRLDENNELYFIKFSKDVILKMMEKFMKEKRVDSNNIMHVDDADAGSYTFECWTVENLEDKANSIYGQDVPIGTWMVKMRVTNDETWRKVKCGELRGFSLQGNFTDEKAYKAYKEDMEYKKIYDDLREMINNL